MSTSCPNGHASDWEDWCSVCGERLGAESATPSGDAASPDPQPDPPAAAPDPTPAVSGPTCDNCGAPRRDHDVFCESCGYDFASGSLPEAASPVETSPPEQAVHARITVDPDFFAASVGDVDLELPDPLPDAQLVPMPGIRILIGRQSNSRGIYPEIDLRALTDDPAVSSRHAMLERAATGGWTVTDLGSTNGTFLTADAGDPIASGTALPIAPGAKLWLGAWSCIELVSSAD